MPVGLDPAVRVLRRLLAALAITAGVALALVLLAAWWVSAPATDAPVTASPEAEAAARGYLAALAPLPEGWEPGRFAPEPGVSLETGFLAAAAPRRGTVVLVPGYTAPLELYAEEYAALSAAGWDVAAISQRGQGRSDRFGAAPDMGHVEDYADLTRDLSAWIAEQDGPVALMGISKGGHVALRTLAEREPDVVAAAVIVPMIRFDTGPFPPLAARALTGAADRFGLGHRYAPGLGPWDRAERFLDAGFTGTGTVCSADATRAHLRDALYVLDPALRVDAPSLGWVAATFRSQSLLDGMAGRVGVPVLMVTAGEDRIVSTPAASRFCDAMGACREVRLPDAPHCALEGDRARSREIMAEVIAFLEGG